MASSPNHPHITLYRGFREQGSHVWSPFVVKVEARLRFAGVKYVTAAGGPRQAPKGKIPYVELRAREGEEAVETLCDSTLMFKELTARGLIPDLNASLGPVERNHDLSLRALLEDKLYFFNGWEKWTQNYYTQREKLLWPVPWPMRYFVGLMIYRGQMATYHGQGTGRFTAEEIFAFREEIWASVAELLRSTKSSKNDDHAGVFWALGGEEPTEVDATLFGFIASVMVCTSNPVAQKEVQSHPILLEYANRIHDKYFPDYEKW